LASALCKISENPTLCKEAPDDVAQPFIEHFPSKAAFASLFTTHPPIKNRYRYFCYVEKCEKII